jgi:hypothetical protein
MRLYTYKRGTYSLKLGDSDSCMSRDAVMRQIFDVKMTLREMQDPSLAYIKQ